MGAVEDAVDAAADFIGPFVDKDKGSNNQEDYLHLEPDTLVKQALYHLQAIDAADKAADPDAPYDASLAGVVYGLLDLVTSVGILPHLSAGVVFSQRPRSVLVSAISIPSCRNESLLSFVVKSLIPILEENGLGVQPLLSQRVLPDIITAVAELSFSPEVGEIVHSTYLPIYERILLTTPTSRLLPILTTLLEQNLPTWLKRHLSKELAMVPLRSHGVRHTIEFLSLSYMSKNSQVPQDASGLQSKIPIPLEAIAQASRLLVSPPSGMSQEAWITELAPQLLILLDGSEGKELSRAAGHIIAAGILGKKVTGAPGSVGWNLFARPIFQTIYPKNPSNITSRTSTSDQVITQEQDLRLALQRLSAIVTSYSHAGLLKRLIGPVLLPLWGLLCYARERPSLNKEWREVSKGILSQYLTIACDPKDIDTIAANLFWDGESIWIFGPGSQGGVEIRRRQDNVSDSGVGGILSRIGLLNDRVDLLISLLIGAHIPDEVAGAIFVQTTKRWLSPSHNIKQSLVDEPDIDPLAALVDAKLSETMATKFKDKFARSPQHIIELMAQLLQNFIKEHQSSQKGSKSDLPSRHNLGNIVNVQSNSRGSAGENESEELASFALSILHTLITSEDLKQTPEITKLVSSVLPSLEYLAQPHRQTSLPPLIANAAANLLQIISPATPSIPTTDEVTEYHASLKTAIKDLTSPEPPNRTWALHTIQTLIKTPPSFIVIDVPSMTHMLLSASIADPESYVHTAAVPVLVDLAVRAPNPTIRIIVDAFIDIDERSLKLRKEKDIQEALDFRLRVGEVVNKFILHDVFWSTSTNVPDTKHTSLKMIVEATLSVASRRGQRKKTLSARTLLANEERKLQEEGEAAWGGPIPNLLDPEGENPAEQAERDTLLKIVQGWEDTGIEEDVRIRASALSVLGSIMESRLQLLSQITVDAGLQMSLLILTMETGESKGILRRAAVLVVMGLLRGMDAMLEGGKESAVGLGMKQNEEVERVMKWVRDEDGDALVRGHAENVVEGLETLSMKKLYRLRDEGLRLGPDLGLEGNLRGLDVRPNLNDGNEGKKKLIVEEIE